MHRVRACVRACVRAGVACTVAHAYHAYPCAPPLRACPPRGRRAGAGSQLRRATRQGPGEFVVGCLLSAVIAGRGRAVKAVGGARPLRRCADLHTPTTRPQRCQRKSMPPTSACSSHSTGTTGSDYCENRATTGPRRDSPKRRNNHATSIKMGGGRWHLKIVIAADLHRSAHGVLAISLFGAHAAGRLQPTG